jgi:hypothetical protein
MRSSQRDRLVQGVRAARWAAGLGAAGLTAAFSVAAAHAFKGHDGRKSTAAAPAPAKTSSARKVTVPGPDNVPAIAGDVSLQPPQEAPQSAPPQQQQQVPQQQQAPQQQAPPVSGGS